MRACLPPAAKMATHPTLACQRGSCASPAELWLPAAVPEPPPSAVAMVDGVSSILFALSLAHAVDRCMQSLLANVVSMLTWLLNWRMEKISSRGSSQLACKESDVGQQYSLGGVQRCMTPHPWLPMTRLTRKTMRRNEKTSVQKKPV